MRLMTLIVEIDSLLKSNSQFIIATHSPILMAFPNAEILQFSESGIEKGFIISPQNYCKIKCLKILTSSIKQYKILFNYMSFTI